MHRSENGTAFRILPAIQKRKTVRSPKAGRLCIIMTSQSRPEHQFICVLSLAKMDDAAFSSIILNLP